MGDISDLMQCGVLCQQCGGYVGDDVGYPRYCADCEPLPSVRVKVACPICGRKVKHNGVADHIRAAHPGEGVKG